MTPDYVVALARQALTVALLLAAPALLAALVVGVVISIFQATTQIQEPTLTFVPKILAVFLVLLLLGAWMGNIMLTFTREVMGNLSSLVR